MLKIVCFFDFFLPINQNFIVRDNDWNNDEIIIEIMIEIIISLRFLEHS